MQQERKPGILLVEDDGDIAGMTTGFLAANGYRAMSVRDGPGMDRLLGRHSFDLILLDVMLPGDEDGLALCRRLRATSNIPVIILSARGEEVDRIIGLEMGADDYLAKPFGPRELLARVRAVLRRSRETSHDGKTAREHRHYHFNGFVLDIPQRQLRGAGGERIPLTGAEFELLRVLCEHPHRVLTRDQLLDLTQGRHANAFERSIDILVSRLRRKIESDPREPELIRTVRSGGYVFSGLLTVRAGGEPP